MYILGISGFYHNSAACLLKTGNIIAAAEEERFNRIKHSSGLPIKTIEFCLEAAEIDFNQIDYIVYYGGYLQAILGGIKDLFKINQHLLNIIKIIIFHLYMLVSYEVEKFRMLEKFKSLKPKLSYINHHFAHAASAFFVSPYESAAILINDAGVGTSFFIGEKNKIRKINEINSSHSIAFLYSSITDYLGFTVNNDEYKVMGLASYGSLPFYNEFKKIIKFNSHGNYEINLSYFIFHKTGRAINSVSKKFIEKFGLPRNPGEPIAQRHKDIAAALQKITEEVIMHLVDYLYDITKLENLCIAGGVGLNSVVNGKILKQSKFKNIFIQPSSHDAGCAIGCAYYVYHQILGNPRKYVMEHDYFGPEFSDKQIEEILQNSKVKYTYFSDIEKITAQLLADGKIVGWFQGRMEFGPRALGNRSILADPTRKDMTDIVNKWVKHREDFRPFAPAVLEDEAAEYFNIDRPSPFMLFVVPVREEMKNRIPAITHVDSTARVQTVSKKTNPIFWNLINEFKKLKGVPVILNTSFNVRGEPIVCTPKDALRCFFSTGIDCLIMGNYLINKI